jgi:hypothetical protein
MWYGRGAERKITQRWVEHILAPIDGEQIKQLLARGFLEDGFVLIR